jgi:hypothetical protein
MVAWWLHGKTTSRPAVQPGPTGNAVHLATGAVPWQVAQAQAASQQSANGSLHLPLSHNVKEFYNG